MVSAGMIIIHIKGLFIQATNISEIYKRMNDVVFIEIKLGLFWFE